MCVCDFDNARSDIFYSFVSSRKVESSNSQKSNFKREKIKKMDSIIDQQNKAAITSVERTRKLSNLLIRKQRVYSYIVQMVSEILILKT